MNLRTVEEFCPAKINLTLHVLGKRADGFHNLHSIVAQTRHADRLLVTWDEAGHGPDTVSIEGSREPIENCSVLQAFGLVREATGIHSGRLCASLTKRIPVGAGLGGGSSDAVGALRALRRLWPDSTQDLDWAALALRIGSDCPLFLQEAPVLMSGQGEVLSPLPYSLQKRLRGQEVLLLKPPFSVNTAEAYRRLAQGAYYSSELKAQSALMKWQQSDEPLPDLHNDFMRLVEGWMPSLPVFLRGLRERYSVDTQMSGSGSACFAFSERLESITTNMVEDARTAWGPGFWFVRTGLK